MTLDVYADIACPWCYIGERRLFAALAQRPALDVTPRWRPFQLQPDLPAGGVPWRAFAEQKFGGWERALAMFGHVQRAAEPDGIAFDFEHIAAAVNTADAHRLILHGRKEGREWTTARTLFKAYFEESLNLAERDVLLEVAARAGLNALAAADWLASDAGRAEVTSSQEEATRLGVRGVPFVVLDGRLGLSGAQPVDVFLQALDQASGTPSS